MKMLLNSLLCNNYCLRGVRQGDDRITSYNYNLQYKITMKIFTKDTEILDIVIIFMSYRRIYNDNILYKFHWIPFDDYRKAFILPKTSTTTLKREITS